MPGRLSQMRGVLSVLGLDQAAQAVLRMRDTVQGLLAAAPEAPLAGVESLGNSLGALGFLVDMLGYQPALARKPDSYKQRSVAAMSTEADFESLLQNPEVLQRMH
mgnify:CR=1 FL=1